MEVERENETGIIYTWGQRVTELTETEMDTDRQTDRQRKNEQGKNIIAAGMLELNVQEKRLYVTTNTGEQRLTLSIPERPPTL